LIGDAGGMTDPMTGIFQQQSDELFYVFSVTLLVGLSVREWVA